MGPFFVFQYEELQDITGIPSASPRTPLEFDEEVKNPQEGRGVKGPCAFNKLQAFHCIGNFPCDSLHDLLEKIIPCDAAAVLHGLISDGYFSLEQYNTMMASVTLHGYEISDKPLPVKSKCDKLPGKAFSVALHMRLMPYIIWRLLGEPDDMDMDNELLKLMVILSKLNEYVSADVMSVLDVLQLEDLVVEFFSARKVCCESYAFCRLTPKYHNLEHYFATILRHGPLNAYSTARPEAKHQVFKGFCESAKNFINITKTVAEKHQRLLASE